MLERETLFFWIAAQRLRLSPRDDAPEHFEEAVDALLAIQANTESLALAQRCDALLVKEAERCGFLA